MKVKVALWTVVLLQTVTVNTRTTQGYTVDTGETQGTLNNSIETQNDTRKTQNDTRITLRTQNKSKTIIVPKGFRVVSMKTRERLFCVVLVIEVF